MQTRYKHYKLHFKFKARTSRDELRVRDTWFVKIHDPKSGKKGVGECSPIRGLSIDNTERIEEVIQKGLDNLKNWSGPLVNASVSSILKSIIPNGYPAVRCGVEMALLDYFTAEPQVFFENCFYRGNCNLPINGLIWMGDHSFMEKQIQKKLEEGYDCIKIKIGALDFESELDLLKFIRQKYSPEQVTIRVDANGAFDPEEALGKLEKLGAYGVHSIEQPIKPGQWQKMAELCRYSPVPIALDEELIGVENPEEIERLLHSISPQYLIFKPTLLGGFFQTDQWIKKATALGIGWWITSALESNVGLSALAQFTANYAPAIPQGLGTGMLYSNNIPSPLKIKNGKLFHDPMENWEFSFLNI